MRTIPCPSCGGALHEARCTACGGPGLVALAQGDAAPACAVHPTRRSSATCERCGRFCCAVCLVVVDERLLCRTCPAPRERVPWEAESLPGPLAYVRTAWAFLVRPRSAARALEAQGQAGPALVFLLTSFAITLLSSLGALGAMMDRRQVDGLGLFIAALYVPVLGALWAIAIPSGQWLTLRLIKQPTSFSTCFKASAYASAPLLLGAVPFLGCTLLPVWCLVLQVLILVTLARLEGMEIWLVALAIPLALVVLVFSVSALASALW